MPKKKTQKGQHAAALENKEKPSSSKRLITLDSTQKWSPVKDVLDGVVITKDNRFVQILEFSPINFALLPEAEQDSIASAFGAAIRTFPSRFQIKILSRKADVETHIRNLHRHMEQETNPSCRQMQMQSMQLIQENATNGVSRRFFIAFEYEAPNSLRRPAWSDIYSSLFFRANQIISQLSASPCNNAPLSPLGDSVHTMDILYNCICRAEAEIKPYDIKMQDIVAAHIIEHGYDPNSNLQIPVNDFITPRRIDTDAFTYTVVDGKYYCFGYIHQKSYPTRTFAGWMSNLVNLGEGIDVDIWVEQKPTAEISSKLTYSMKVSHSNYEHKSNTSADIVDLENKIKSENYIRSCLTNGHAFLYFAVMLTVVADNPTALKARFKAVQDALSTIELKVMPLHGNHDLALRSSLPLCNPDKRLLRNAQRNILSADFGGAYPFTSYEINDPNGVMVGRNLVNNSPLFIDLFDRYLYSNGNAVILGGSGSGKTYTMQLLALRLRQYQTRVIIVAPYKGHEYYPACKAIDGTYISLAPGSPQNINIMEIRKHKISGDVIAEDPSAAKGSLLIEKVQQLRTFFSLLKPHMTHREIHILDDALMNTYKRFGITPGNKSLYDPLHPTQFKKMPILGDLDASLSEYGREATELRNALSPFVTGSCRSFNGPTNVNLDNPYVVLDISNMPDALLPIGSFIANDLVYDVIRGDELERKAIFNDELSRLIGVAGAEAAAKFVVWEAKTVRAYNAIFIAGTQDTNDFFALDDGRYGKSILANSRIKLIMKQEPEEVPTITKMLMLSDQESRRLNYYEPGQGLLIANRNHIEIKVVASSAEDLLINTNPEIKKRRSQEGQERM